MNFTVTFFEPEDVSHPSHDGSMYSFPYSIVDSTLIGSPEEKSRTSYNNLVVEISRTRRSGWHLSDQELPKILFEYGKRHLVSLVASRTLDKESQPRLIISTLSHPECPCPFDTAAIPAAAGHMATVETTKPKIGFTP